MINKFTTMSLKSLRAESSRRKTRNSALSSQKHNLSTNLVSNDSRLYSDSSLLSRITKLLLKQQYRKVETFNLSLIAAMT